MTTRLSGLIKGLDPGEGKTGFLAGLQIRGNGWGWWGGVCEAEMELVRIIFTRSSKNVNAVPPTPLPLSTESNRMVSANTDLREQRFKAVLSYL